MTTPISTVDIDNLKLLTENRVLKCQLVMGDDKEYMVKIAMPDNQIDAILHLIREVAKEVIGEYEDSGKIEWHGEEDARIAGRDDLRSEQRTKLNKILGEK